MSRTTVIRADLSTVSYEKISKALSNHNIGTRIRIGLRYGNRMVDTTKDISGVLVGYNGTFVALKRRKNSKEVTHLHYESIARIYFGRYNKGIYRIGCVEWKMFYVRITKTYDGLEDSLKMVFECPVTKNSDEQDVWEYVRDLYGEDEELSTLSLDKDNLHMAFESADGTTAWHLDRWERLTEQEYTRLYDLFYGYKY